MQVRPEKKEDFQAIEQIIIRAFENEEMSDQTEHQLVGRLRNSDAYVPELSLVAVEKGEIIGHLMLTKVTIGENDSLRSLALAPVSVHPSYQNQGVGKALIEHALKKSGEKDYESVIVLGHPGYYSRFGFQPASKYGIVPPFEVPDEAFMAFELRRSALTKVFGTVHYSNEFFKQS
ncbi:GNAT family N-acetyltransferase [Halobacillus faecis]|uniref:N-acetyltransferase n=1 Tax=Halobacillus faecis TaxID=360184 RepID=A0A511WPP1_9BACI|nr:N-acetyltransferase [Halobacillus faecis]GEN52203.1 N-acetyltransferase [Halobacillus faecis]